MNTAETARALGIEEATVRRWVMKGWLRPVEPRTKPLTFHPDEVERARSRRLTDAQHQAIDDTWAEVRRRAS